MLPYPDPLTWTPRGSIVLGMSTPRVRLEMLCDEIQRLAEDMGIPDPGAADTETLITEMWARVNQDPETIAIETSSWSSRAGSEDTQF